MSTIKVKSIGRLNESKATKEMSQADITEVKNLTSANNHNESRLFIAKAMKNKKLADAYEGIILLHKYFGHMPSELDKIKQKIEKNLESCIKDYYTNADEIINSL